MYLIFSEHGMPQIEVITNLTVVVFNKYIIYNTFLYFKEVLMLQIGLWHYSFF